MSKRIFIVAILAMAMTSFSAYAQMDEHAPGLYTIVGGEYVPLEYKYQLQGSVGIGIGAIGIQSQKRTYSGVTSGVIASDTFILVVDPKKKSGTMSPKKYPFLCYMTPEDMLILPLEINVKKKRREYDPGLGLSIGVGIGSLGGTLKDERRTGFEWERCTDNSFKIKIESLTPGEYGIILRPAKLGDFEYTGLFGFTVPETPAAEEQPKTGEQPAADTTAAEIK